MKNFLSYFKLFFSDRSSILFLTAVILGLAFSVSVIVSTFSLMEGFELSLENGLQQNQGDISVSGRRHFFTIESVEETFKRLDIRTYSPVITSESFLVTERESHGALVKGIISKTFQKVTGKSIYLKEKQVAIGEELAKRFGLVVGDDIQLLFAAGSKSFSNTPISYSFKVASIIKSRLYQESLRVVYMDQAELQKILALGDKVNEVVLKMPGKYLYPSRSDIQGFANVLQDELGYEFVSRTFWEKYAGLLQAVKIEKFYIVAILQVIVVVSIFNIMALLVFISEKKAAQIFLLQVLGMTKSRFTFFWYCTVFCFWLLGCLLSLGFTLMFSQMLEKWEIFKVPGSVYHLSKLELSMNPYEVIIVFAVVLLWMFAVTWWSLRRWKQGPLIQRMRKEYN